MKKRDIRENAITLVALVITIILLLILAGITINSLTGSGLFEKTKEAKQKSENEQIKENITLGEYESAINQEINGTRSDKKVEDYTTNLIYKLNLNNLESQQGITINGTGITTSNDKKYLTFGGSSYISVNNDTIDPNSVYRNEQDATLCCWYRTTNTNPSVILKYGEAGYNGVYNVHYLNINSGGSMRAGQGYNTCTKGADPSNSCDGNWHFIVGIWKENNTVQFYYDGVPFTSTGRYTNTNTYFDIGGTRDGLYYTGDLSDIRLYREALTENEVKQLYRYGKNYLGIE